MKHHHDNVLDLLAAVINYWPVRSRATVVHRLLDLSPNSGRLNMVDWVLS